MPSIVAQPRTQRPALPKRLWRVEYLEGFGWPICTRREHARRTFTSAQHAADFVATLDRWPEHHRLLGVWTTDTDWHAVDLDNLPAAQPAADTED